VSDLDNLEVDRVLARRLTRSWDAFFGRHGRLRPLQRQAIPLVLDGLDTLVVGPTASGKTEAAAAPLAERLVRVGEAGIVIYIVPTRALANDVFERLYGPMHRCGIEALRRTGEYKSHPGSGPSIVVTTPESLDSMLCRGRFPKDDAHELDRCVGLVLDEVHLLAGTARGEQVRFLTERIRRLRYQAWKAGRTRSGTLQIVALSATVGDPDGIAGLLGVGFATVGVTGQRPIDDVGPGRPIDAADALAERLASGCREKVLVFSRSRKRVDELAVDLNARLAQYGYCVLAHHGSLARAERERAEKVLKSEERVVIVATSTLELGIDVGDIDVVVMDGVPVDVRSFLQRVGRGSRRTARTSVMLCAIDHGEFLVMRAMLVAARESFLPSRTTGKQLAVVRQQAASFVFQGRNSRRSQIRLLQFLEGVCDPRTARAMVETMKGRGELITAGSYLGLGKPWIDMTTSGGIHSTIEAGQLGRTVVDAATGTALAIGVEYRGGERMRVAGRDVVVEKADRDIRVRVTRNENLGDADWSYAPRAFFIDTDQPQCVRNAYGFSRGVWPVISVGGRRLALHLGGSLLGAALNLIVKSVKDNGLSADAWCVDLEGVEVARRTLLPPPGLAEIVEQTLPELERTTGRPRANRNLPDHLRRDEVLSWLPIDTVTSMIAEAKLTPLRDLLDDNSVSEIIKILEFSGSFETTK
jgi:ATP-dependent Lhr-like helicase